MLGDPEAGAVDAGLERHPNNEARRQARGSFPVDLDFARRRDVVERFNEYVCRTDMDPAATPGGQGNFAAIRE